MCCGGLRMCASTGSAAPTSGKAQGTNATSQKHFEALWKSMPTRAEAVLEVKRLYTRYWAKSFVAVAMWWCRVGTWGLTMRGGCRTCNGAHSYSTTIHCKNFLSLASPFLLCCNASIFFRILFSSLCCAVIGFVAGIVHGVLFDTFCFWACNSL